MQHIITPTFSSEPLEIDRLAGSRKRTKLPAKARNCATAPSSRRTPSATRRVLRVQTRRKTDQRDQHRPADALDVAAGSPGHYILRGLYGTVILGPGKIMACTRSLKEETMPDRILTSHAGSLPRPEEMIALNEQRAAGDFSHETEYLGRLRAAVADVVARERKTGIDLVNDGEYGHLIGIGI
jgi:hypothetical protein